MKLKRLLITLLLPVLYFVQVQAQSRPAAKQPARPDTATLGVLCENAQGEQGVVYNKTGGEFHRINSAATTARVALPVTSQAVKPAAKTTITKTASAPAKTVSTPAAAAKAAPPKATPPPVLEEHH